jgi:hypothetical protein
MSEEHDRTFIGHHWVALVVLACIAAVVLFLLMR